MAPTTSPTFSEDELAALKTFKSLYEQNASLRIRQFKLKKQSTSESRQIETLKVEQDLLMNQREIDQLVGKNATLSSDFEFIRKSFTSIISEAEKSLLKNIEEKEEVKNAQKAVKSLKKQLIESRQTLLQSETVLQDLRLRLENAEATLSDEAKALLEAKVKAAEDLVNDFNKQVDLQFKEVEVAEKDLTAKENSFRKTIKHIEKLVAPNSYIGSNVSSPDTASPRTEPMFTFSPEFVKSISDRVEQLSRQSSVASLNSSPSGTLTKPHHQEKSLVKKAVEKAAALANSSPSSAAGSVEQLAEREKEKEALRSASAVKQAASALANAAAVKKPTETPATKEKDAEVVRSASTSSFNKSQSQGFKAQLAANLAKGPAEKGLLKKPTSEGSSSGSSTPISTSNTSKPLIKTGTFGPTESSPSSAGSEMAKSASIDSSSDAGVVLIKNLDTKSRPKKLTRAKSVSSSVGSSIDLNLDSINVNDDAPKNEPAVPAIPSNLKIKSETGDSPSSPVATSPYETMERSPSKTDTKSRPKKLTRAKSVSSTVGSSIDLNLDSININDDEPKNVPAMPAIPSNLKIKSGSEDTPSSPLATSPDVTMEKSPSKAKLESFTETTIIAALSPKSLGPSNLSSSGSNARLSNASASDDGVKLASPKRLSANIVVEKPKSKKIKRICNSQEMLDASLAGSKSANGSTASLKKNSTLKKSSENVAVDSLASLKSSTSSLTKSDSMDKPKKLARKSVAAETARPKVAGNTAKARKSFTRE